MRDEKTYQYLVKQDIQKHDRVLEAMSKVDLVPEEEISSVSNMGIINRRRHEGILSDHQADMLYLAANGYGNQKIADELGLTINTVIKVLSLAYKNLDIPFNTSYARALAVARAHRLGIIWRTF